MKTTDPIQLAAEARAKSDGDHEAASSSELDAFNAFKSAFLDGSTSFAKEIDRFGPSVIGGFGAAVIAAGLAMHMTLASAEFIVTVIVGAVLLCAGAGLFGVQVRAVERREEDVRKRGHAILMRSLAPPPPSESPDEDE